MPPYPLDFANAKNSAYAAAHGVSATTRYARGNGFARTRSMSFACHPGNGFAHPRGMSFVRPRDADLAQSRGIRFTRHRNACPPIPATTASRSKMPRS